MRIDSGISGGLGAAATQAHEAENAGYDGVWSAETAHDPFLSLAIAAERTERVRAWHRYRSGVRAHPDDNRYRRLGSQPLLQGRFLLGLGSQIKPHIEKRYSMPWSHPAPRMREFISAMRAIWACWQDDIKLDFRGDFYTHTLMTPFFNPGPNEYGAPKVFLAAVGTGMTRVAGEVADGMLVHGFTTERYFREVTLPALEGGLAVSGRRRADFQLSYPAFVVTGNSEDQLAVADAATRKQIAFYPSTRAYRLVLDTHGWGDLQPELNILSKRGEWDEMGMRISDEMLETFAVKGSPDEIPSLLQRRFGDVIDRLRLYMPYGGPGSEDAVNRIRAGLKLV